MHIKSVRLRTFKRFTDLSIQDLPPTAKLVVLTGANGSGKSAILEAFNVYRRVNHFGFSHDPDYYVKVGASSDQYAPGLINIEFHEGDPDQNPGGRRSAMWIRSAYRHQPDFSNPGIQQMPSVLEDAGSDKLITSEQYVATNYARLASSSIRELYDSANREKRAGEITDGIIGPLQRSLRAVLGDLQLDNLNDPLVQGTFYFSKGESHGFPFKNLSAGERAVFDLLLDMIIRVKTYDDTVYCIDEPETHLSTRVQGLLLKELLNLLPESSQLWVATHSPGMMRTAMQISEETPDAVAFLDTYGQEFDGVVEMRPIVPSVDFWRRALDVALDDLADLVAPETLVLCEGAETDGFDAQVYRRIFAQTHPRAQFLSVGNAHEVETDTRGVAAAVQVVAPGTRILRLVDRDDRDEDEVAALRDNGVRVLSHRNIESYLLSDDALRALYASADTGTIEAAERAIQKREELLSAAVASRSVPPDDYKRVRNDMREYLRRDLRMTRAGSNTNQFLLSNISMLLRPGMAIFEQLEEDIFGS